MGRQTSDDQVRYVVSCLRGDAKVDLAIIAAGSEAAWRQTAIDRIRQYPFAARMGMRRRASLVCPRSQHALRQLVSRLCRSRAVLDRRNARTRPESGRRVSFQALCKWRVSASLALRRWACLEGAT